MIRRRENARGFGCCRCARESYQDEGESVGYPRPTAAELLARTKPHRFVANMSQARRKGRMFLDYLRNCQGSTAVCPWSTRARAGGTVAVPVTWEEL